MQHNLVWFNHYIFGDPLPDFDKRDVPKKDEKEWHRSASRQRDHDVASLAPGVDIGVGVDDA
jgi:hypothetical protein